MASRPFESFRLSFLAGILLYWGATVQGQTPACEDLLLGQYTCRTPVIDNSTQAAVGCLPNRTVRVACMPVNGTECNNRTFTGAEEGFSRTVSCRYVGDKRFDTALALSVFLGMFGFDRFYLGYPAIGLLKLSTFGFFMLGQLIDVVLIAAQIVGPADGTDYRIDYYGPRLDFVSRTNETYLVPND